MLIHHDHKKTVLYLVCFIGLSTETNLLDAEIPDIYDLAANVLQEIKTKLPATVHHSSATSNEQPEISTASKSVQQFKKHNAYKNQKGYTFSEVFHNGVKDGPTTAKSEVIPESRFLYHSLENPLFTSNSLNLHSDDDNEPVISDVHKISSPFESKWIFFPSGKGLAKGGSGLSASSSTFDILKRSRGVRTPLDSSPLTASFKSIPSLGDSRLGDSRPFGSLLASTTSAPALVDTSSTEKSFYGYNLEEVKTADGKTRGVVQIFDQDGLKRNVHYDEKGPVVDQQKVPAAANASASGKVANASSSASKANPVAGAKTPEKPGNSGAPASSKATQNGTARVGAEPTTTSTEPSYWNQHFVNFTNYALPSEEVEYNQPPVATNSFATPEYILFNFLGQLSSVPFIPSNENFVTNELNSFDESVDENSFFFAEK